ncbi:MAG: DUF502 domain-containing protein [Pseudomonadota bacterium]|uniref:DUF502 domain-containing protein n=1 Tax=Candidatus Desulfatibia profunda TaxID=2841695 RepID=A0A8J6NV66_9BACT|nr:DUF502 domain-containing protein [Candidatus Desulfatibia profunda]MBL7179431.1 DUF502 domain-containing protein [Desulfobacterales bacterium]MBU0699417.1 DUF502 domain-containing protein [Pseudomonadota bacterium]
MSRFNTFIQNSLIGGVAVILPVALSAFLLKWLFMMVTGIIRPLTTLVFAKSNIQVVFADAIVIAIILFGCFFVGVVVRTRLGIFIQESLEAYILKFAPGYSIIKETVMQFLGKKKFPFSPVVLVRAFENDTLMTGFVTDEHPGGLCTVFVPTGPNVTTGFVFHLSQDNVYPVNVSADQAIRTVISCGVGSGKLLKAYSEDVSRPQNE